ALLPHSETRPAAVGRDRAATAVAPDTSGRVAPHIDLDARTISLEFDETGVSRLKLYDAVLGFADRCYVALTRVDASRIGVQLEARGEAPTGAPRALTTRR